MSLDIPSSYGMGCMICQVAMWDSLSPPVLTRNLAQEISFWAVPLSVSWYMSSSMPLISAALSKSLPAPMWNRLAEGCGAVAVSDAEWAGFSASGRIWAALSDIAAPFRRGRVGTIAPGFSGRILPTRTSFPAFFILFISGSYFSVRR